MAAIRRHWKLVVLNVFLFCLSVGAVMWYIGRHAMSARTAPVVSAADAPPATPTSPTPLDLGTYSHLQVLRQRLCLTDRDLAAMGCSQNQANTILATLLTWDQFTQSSWDQATQSQQAAQGNLQSAWRQINVGTGGDTALAQLPSLQQSLSSAISARQQIEQGVATQVAGQLTQAQSAIWQAAQANVAASAPEIYRYAPGLSSTQLGQIQLAAAQRQSFESVITVSQQSAIATAATNQQQSINGVLAAELSVLPPPTNFPFFIGK